MPLTRAALYAQGMDLQIALWPGSVRNTSDVTRFVAFESRSFVVSVSGLLSRDDIGDSLPYYTEIRQNSQNDWLADGGTCIAGPDGTWVMEPVRYKEGLFVYVLEHRKVLEERQNFDPSGHYTRPDVLKLFVSREYNFRSVLRTARIFYRIRLKNKTDIMFKKRISTAKKVLITAGPTQEAIDPVRLISTWSIHLYSWSGSRPPQICSRRASPILTMDVSPPTSTRSRS